MSIFRITAILAATVVATNVTAAEKPNVVIIVADDLGWGHVGWQNPKVQTPHLDRLAENGVKLNDHYVAPVCSPTRVALMTGRYWSRFGVLGPLPSEPTSLARAMPSDTTTIASALKASGYRTALVGKWHLGAQPDAGPEAFGFDYFHGLTDEWGEEKRVPISPDLPFRNPETTTYLVMKPLTLSLARTVKKPERKFWYLRIWH